MFIVIVFCIAAVHLSLCLLSISVCILYYVAHPIVYILFYIYTCKVIINVALCFDPPLL